MQGSESAVPFPVSTPCAACPGSCGPSFSNPKTSSLLLDSVSLLLVDSTHDGGSSSSLVPRSVRRSWRARVRSGWVALPASLTSPVSCSRGVIPTDGHLVWFCSLPSADVLSSHLGVLISFS